MKAVMDPLAVSFSGNRSGSGAAVTMTVAGVTRPLPTHHELRNHSPGGFEWGYAGSGPAQLALAMCVELVGDRVAEYVYQGVKDRLVSGIRTDEWTLAGTYVLRLIEAEYAWRKGEPL
jgi:hypothetical protein